MRDEDGLRRAHQVLGKIEKEKIGRLCLGGKRSCKPLAALVEVENLLMVGRLIVLAAMERRETRGAHYREDYPELDESWSKNIVLQLERGKTRVKMKPVVQSE
jgi:succinate dehydrogenase/fumarate reductase flavoprotein subunit